MTVLSRVAIVVAALVFVPSAVIAQASITGVINTSGALLPGVTVAAASEVFSSSPASALSNREA